MREERRRKARARQARIDLREELRWRGTGQRETPVHNKRRNRSKVGAGRFAVACLHVVSNAPLPEGDEDKFEMIFQGFAIEIGRELDSQMELRGLRAEVYQDLDNVARGVISVLVPYAKQHVVGGALTAALAVFASHFRCEVHYTEFDGGDEDFLTWFDDHKADAVL